MRQRLSHMQVEMMGMDDSFRIAMSPFKYGDGSNLVPLVNIKIAGKWMFIPLKMVLIGIDPSPYDHVLI